ncbi:MAG: LON peptidase substrate-binding domain-containing protein [Bacteroidetes bacterium]|nr:LON peptidase substrate-binding domain-containing protein [Bacteroidota bacterium]
MNTQNLTIPMFPLNMVLLVGETTKLHIFEERYKQLVNECYENNASFGIPFLDKGKVQVYGSEVKIKRILKKYSDGSMDILIEGLGAFKLLEYSKKLTPKLYGAGLIESLNNNQKITLNALQDALVNYFGNIQNKFVDYETIGHMNVFNVAASLQLTQLEKYNLIASKNPQFLLLNQIKFITHVINIEHTLRDSFINN